MTAALGLGMRMKSIARRVLASGCGVAIYDLDQAEIVLREVSYPASAGKPNLRGGGGLK
jgi:hypothetical protein